VGANLFIGNLDIDVDEKLLYDTFSAFGVIISTPKIMREEGGGSRGFGFISFDSFESSDAAIAAMNGQFLGGRPISVSYALKKDSKQDRHGSQAERLLAANNPGRSRPHTMFASAPTGMGRGFPMGAPMPGMPMPPQMYGQPMPPMGYPMPPPPNFMIQPPM